MKFPHPPADGSSVLCKYVGNVSIPIRKNKKKLGSSILEDTLIGVPNLDRHLFSVNAFLSKGHNWVYLPRHTIKKLEINDGPSINIPITSLQSNAIVVENISLGVLILSAQHIKLCQSQYMLEAKQEDQGNRIL